MPFYSRKSLVWNPFLELLVGVLQFFNIFYVYSPYLTWTHNFTKWTINLLKGLFTLTDTLQRDPVFWREHPSWKLVASANCQRQVVAALNGQEEQILTKQRKCNRLRPVWWSCLVMRITAKMFPVPGWWRYVHDMFHGTYIVWIVCFKSVREEFCAEIDSNSCFFDDNIIHIGNIYLVNLHHGSTMDNISGGCSRFCISRVPEPSHPLSFLPWHESHCSRCCWLLSWHHGPCPVASWHQKCKKTWNMWQEAIWEAGGGRGSFVLGFKMFVFRLFNLFPPDSQLIPTGTFKPPTCWLPLVLGGSAVVKMIHVNQPPGA